MTDIVAVAPTELTIQQPVSADEHIISRRQVAIIPREQNVFGQQSGTVNKFNENLANRLTFFISDPRGFLNGMDSYITGEFEAYVQTVGGDKDLEAFLDDGGIHACIASIVVRVGSATIERIEDYSKLYNAVKFASVGEIHHNSVEMMALDGSADYKELIPDYQYPGGLNEYSTSMGTGNVTIVQDDQTITLANAVVFTSGLEIGDNILIEGKNAAEDGNFSATVIDITSSTVFEIDISPGSSQTGTEIYILSKNKQFQRRSMRNLAVNGIPAEGNTHVNRIRFVMKPFLKSLQMLKYIPLPLLPAPLEIQIEFNPAILALVKRSGTDGGEYGYKITKPRFMASIIEVDDATMADYLRVWENGVLQFPYHSWKRYNNSLVANSTTGQFTFQTNLVSARNVLTLMTDQADTENDVKEAGIVKSQSTFKRNQLKRYRYASGALKFPDYGDVQCDDFTAAEAFSQLQLVFNTHNNTLHNTSMRVDDWCDGEYEVKNVDGREYTVSATKFMMSTPLSKHQSLMSGVDLTHNFLQLDLEFYGTGTPNDINLKTFIMYDAIMELSRVDGILIKS